MNCGSRSSAEGVVIVDVANGSPAQSLGFQRGDMIAHGEQREDRARPATWTRRQGQPRSGRGASPSRARRPDSISVELGGWRDGAMSTQAPTRECDRLRPTACSPPPASSTTRRVRSPTSCARPGSPRWSGRIICSVPTARSRACWRRARSARWCSGARRAPARPRWRGCWREATDLHFEQISAIFSGVADLKKVFEAARARRETGQGTLLFVDEIHRFNRAQQDSFLPVMEDGTIVLVGATTENPSFELNARAAVARARAGVQVARCRGDREAARARRGDRRQAAAARRRGARVARAHGRRRRPRRADAGRGGLARGARQARRSTPRSCRRWCSGARRSTTRRRTATTI